MDEENAFSSDTMQAFLTLREFYHSDSCDTEDTSASDYVAAKDAFLDAVMATEVMTSTETFVHDNNLLSSSTTLRSYIDVTFFDMYPRCGYNFTGLSNLD